MGETTYNRPQITSARQRVIVLTFESPEAAQEWDDAGQPVDFPVDRVTPLSYVAVA